MADATESRHERELGGKLLASVSRSFYLTLKALPGELREPISLGYLLARTADTIADTEAVPAEVRLECLKAFGRLVQNDAEADCSVLATRLKAEFCPHQDDESERRLMERFGEALAWLGTMKGDSLEAIRDVLKPIIAGQELDIQRFPADGRVRSLATRVEVDEYTWLVAGCVGEFWTRLCESEKPGSLDSEVPSSEMRDRGVRLGKALQLINILRDVGEDLEAGRCYLPSEDWNRPGTSELSLSCSEVLKPAWDAWVQRCGEHLDVGLSYVTHVKDGKLRYATALPLLLGAATLAKLQRSNWQEILRGVKISRLDVARILAEAVASCRSPSGVERHYAKLKA
jgi:farnesyl-diphosphate farnesyltransferase